MSEAEADMDAHTVSVTFDDERTGLDQVIEALNQAGYSVGSPQKKD